MSRTVFLTVGTTSFDELVSSATEPQFLRLLVEKGYTRLTLQIGRGSYEPSTPTDVAGLCLEYYRFKPSLRDDMERASLIISHGGSGSITEALSLQKPLIVVVNETLMHNHQTELARKMADDSYCVFTTHRCYVHVTCNTPTPGHPSAADDAWYWQKRILRIGKLYSTMEGFQASNLIPYEPGNPELFGNFLNKVMGFKENED